MLFLIIPRKTIENGRDAGKLSLKPNPICAKRVDSGPAQLLYS